MNFYSHLAIASLYTEKLGTALGAMLPDFASLIEAKPPQSTDPQIHRGYDLHHATDRVFHEAEQFRHACAVESKNLLSLGVMRATAVAAAHVGLELLLDQELSEDQPTQTLFRSTVTAADADTLSTSLHWGSPLEALRFESLRQRLGSYPLPSSESNSAILAERVCRTLSKRPKLAVRASDRAPLESWAAGLSFRSSAIWPPLIDKVVLGLERLNWHVRPDLARQLRFQRARGDEV